MSVAETKRFYATDIAICRKEPRSEPMFDDISIWSMDEYWDLSY